MANVKGMSTEIDQGTKIDRQIVPGERFLRFPGGVVREHEIYRRETIEEITGLKYKAMCDLDAPKGTLGRKDFMHGGQFIEFILNVFGLEASE
ncbi:hypothetical protein KOR42_50750 [Thalassoglobus neptunius]|uniref:Uncharacterized protein n=1 Tax=Thalassoglobus neptunius TaxID=1938619 RepID=A0A5C5VP67_9PLAN|nr:hypothetical protein [Thalassoglobus neptunius]TWT39900.1 hypothetical protein KOR42_50750 [Thalassoglobus neptunius]